MVFSEWLADKIIEIIIALVGSGAVYYLFQINKNQKASMINSPNSQIIQAQRDVNISSFREGIKKETAFSEEIIEKEDNPKKLLGKIENYLDEDKPISIIAEMSLRLAKKLEMKEDEKWIEKEVKGYTEYLEPGEESKTGLKFKKQEKENQHRRIEAELNLGLKNGQIERFDIPMFISQSLRQIEDWANKYSNQHQIVMNAPPMELMVKDLNVNPNEPVPYLVNPQSFKRILNGVRQKIIDFLDRAKKKKEKYG
ncbi:hypothetical protein HYV50_04380 [Candidatus Pacearchaeota archaeon]|nr:hypothetical protein [Candidatus Pacearchaeota archaeon]